MSRKDAFVWAEMARRKKQFHPNEEWNEIHLWGLFAWGSVSHLLKSGALITDMCKCNKTIWVRPSEEAYRQFIEPLLSEPLDILMVKAGRRS
jgi:hypothetical protein